MKKREMTRRIKDMSTKTCYYNRAGSVSLSSLISIYFSYPSVIS